MLGRWWALNRNSTELWWEEQPKFSLLPLSVLPLCPNFPLSHNLGFCPLFTPKIRFLGNLIWLWFLAIFHLEFIVFLPHGVSLNDRVVSLACIVQISFSNPNFVVSQSEFEEEEKRGFRTRFSRISWWGWSLSYEDLICEVQVQGVIFGAQEDGQSYSTSFGNLLFELFLSCFSSLFCMPLHVLFIAELVWLASFVWSFLWKGWELWCLDHWSLVFMYPSHWCNCWILLALICCLNELQKFFLSN